MKKLSILLMVIIVMLSFVACSSSVPLSDYESVSYTRLLGEISVLQDNYAQPIEIVNHIGFQGLIDQLNDMGHDFDFEIDVIAFSSGGIGGYRLVFSNGFTIFFYEFDVDSDVFALIVEHELLYTAYMLGGWGTGTPRFASVYLSYVFSFDITTFDNDMMPYLIDVTFALRNLAG